MTPIESHFKTLDLEPGASLAEVKQAYRDLAQIWHPDKYQRNPRLRSRAEARFKEINTAYQALLHEYTTQNASPENTCREASASVDVQFPKDGGGSQPRSDAPKTVEPKSRGIAWTIATIIGFALVQSFFRAHAPTSRSVETPPSSRHATPIVSAKEPDSKGNQVTTVNASNATAPTRPTSVLDRLDKTWIIGAQRVDIGPRVVYFRGSVSREPKGVFSVPAVRFLGEVLLLDADLARAANNLAIPEDGSLTAQTIGPESFQAITTPELSMRVAELRKLR